MTMLRSDPSILVLWNQTLVLTTIMSPAHNVIRTSATDDPSVSQSVFTITVKAPVLGRFHNQDTMLNRH